MNNIKIWRLINYKTEIESRVAEDGIRIGFFSTPVLMSNFSWESSNCSRGVETSPRFLSLELTLYYPHSPVFTCCFNPLTHAHLVMPIKQPCSPFQIETDSFSVRIDVW